MGRAVFLDRDGVLNRTEVRDGKPYAPARVADFHLYPQAASCLAGLKDAGFMLVVVTNQPDVGKGLTDRAEVEAMHAQMQAALPLDRVEVCYHARDVGCACRKPKPGMLIAAARALGIDLAASFMIGDRAGDMAAGRAAGCRTVFIDHGYRASEVPQKADFFVSSLTDAVQSVLDFDPDKLSGGETP